MPGSCSVSDLLLHGQIATQTRARNLGQRLKDFGKDEEGQTPTEYLMIVGLMAAVIVLVFVTFYFPQVKAAAILWVFKVRDAVLGTNIK